MTKKSAKETDDKLLLGAHLSIAGGVHTVFDRATALDCTVVQLFLANARQWKPPMITAEVREQFLEKTRKTGIVPAAHATYLINCASMSDEVRRKSEALLAYELAACQSLEIPLYVLHPGNHGTLEFAEAIGIAAEVIDRAFEASENSVTTLLLETTASVTKTIGGSFGHLRDIMDASDFRNRMGICLDTCHVFQAGWDISLDPVCEEMASEFDRILGLGRLGLIHLNDAKAPCGRGLDRHEHIGEGRIGRPAFRFFMTDARFQRTAKCIETPKSKGDENDRMNLRILRAMAMGKRIPKAVFSDERG